MTIQWGNQVNLWYEFSLKWLFWYFNAYQSSVNISRIIKQFIFFNSFIDIGLFDGLGWTWCSSSQLSFSCFKMLGFGVGTFINVLMCSCSFIIVDTTTLWLLFNSPSNPISLKPTSPLFTIFEPEISLCIFMFPDLVAASTIPTEQCQPLRMLPVYPSHHNTVAALQDHDYETHVEDSSQITIIMTKQEVCWCVCAHT